MTEWQWLRSRKPTAMLDFLGRERLGGRKARLFACAVTRLLSPDDARAREQLRRAIEAAEASADGADAGKAMRRFWAANWNVADPDPFSSAYGAASDTALTRRRPTIAGILRCVVGNPFRPTAAGPAVLAWEGGTVPRLAEAVYDERGFDRLPILADALEEAGGPEEAVAHLRSAGPHDRGCWALDLALGR